MNAYTPDGLRAALRDQADFADDRLPQRPAAVRRRVRVRRRRRATAGAVGLAFALVGVLVLPPLWDLDSSRSSRDLLGSAAPATLRAGEDVYEFGEGTEGSGEARLALKPSDQPRLVSWGTTARGNRVTLSSTGARNEFAVPDYSDWVLVPPGRAETVTVRADGDVALASYRLATPPKVLGTPPAQRGDDVLLGGGASTSRSPDRVRVRFAMPSGEVNLVMGCWGAGTSADLWVAQDEKISGYEGPCAESAWQAARTGHQSLPPGSLRTPDGRVAQPGDEVELTVRARGVRGGELGGISLGAYATQTGRRKIAGMSVPLSTEVAGHRYRLQRVVTGQEAALRAELPAGPGRTVVTYGGSGDATASLQLSCTQPSPGCEVQRSSAPLGGGVLIDTAPFTGARTLRLTAEGGRARELGYAIYRQVDGGAAPR